MPQLRRFVVTQNRQAVGVRDPLKLAHHLEKLGGTAALVKVIHTKQHNISQLSQQCEDLTDDTLRYGHPKTLTCACNLHSVQPARNCSRSCTVC